MNVEEIKRAVAWGFKMGLLKIDHERIAREAAEIRAGRAQWMANWRKQNVPEPKEWQAVQPTVRFRGEFLTTAKRNQLFGL